MGYCAIDFRGFNTTSLEQTTLVRLTQDVAIPCNHDTSSMPPPKIAWLKDGQPINIDYRKYVLLYDGKLAIYHLKNSDITNGNKSVEYQCMVTNANVTENAMSPTKHTLRTGNKIVCIHINLCNIIQPLKCTNYMCMFLLLSIGTFPSEVITYHLPPANVFIHKGATLTVFYIYALRSVETVIVPVSVPVEVRVIESTNQGLKRLQVYPIKEDLRVIIYGFTYEYVATHSAYFPVNVATNVSTYVKVIGLLQLAHSHILYCLQKLATSYKCLSVHLSCT